MASVEKIKLSPSRDIPFNKLVLSQSNVRRVKAGVSIEQLAESIAQRTLLQSLSVRAVLDADGQETGKAHQEQVWDNVTRSGNDEPYQIRRMLTENTVRASDRRAQCVGLDVYEQAGGTVSAALITGLRSDLPGQITAQVTENTFDSLSGRFLLIPQGARLIGVYD
jgi:type IV secretory pathway VirB10-like protein